MILPIVLAAQVACPAPFTPPLDRDLTVLTTEERTIGPRTYRSHMTRRLVFRRGAVGLVAELTLQSLGIEAPAPVADAFLAGDGALKDVPLRFRVAADGCSATLIDAEAVAARVRKAGEAMLATRPGNGRATMAALTAHLRAADAETARAFVAEPLASLLPRPGARTPGTVQRDAASFLGESTTLRGTRATSSMPDGLFVREIYESIDGAPAFTLSQRIDLATGLVTEAAQEAHARIGELSQTTRRRTTLSLR